jgi:hypothetical protein
MKRTQVEPRVKRAYVFVPALMLAPSAIAQDALQSNYPPGYDRASVPVGSQREACEESQLRPKVDDDLTVDRPATGAEQETPGTVSPPTMPDQPGDGIRDGGPGTEGGAGGVGD